MARVENETRAEGARLSDERLRELFRELLLIRRFEEKVEERFRAGELPGFLHVAIGQEAIAVGVCAALQPDDVIASTHRAHGHTIAKGTDVNRVMAELYGKQEGCSGGFGGSMHLYDVERGNLGANAVVGGGLPAIVGAALAFKFKGEQRVAVAFFGDGTTNHGYFHECLNFAKVQGLPVLFVCENNLYGEFTPWEDVTAGQILSRPQALEIPAATIDGNDVWVVIEAAGAAVQRARGGGGPQFLEARTYRFVGHSRSDPGKYRKPGELDAWKGRDPLRLARATLAERFDATEDDLDAVDAAVEALIEEIVERGLAAPYPEPAVASEFKVA
jgi:TPP-dependent pyruvate/acetoin dehydrogenase alpha subunit